MLHRVSEGGHMVGRDRGRGREGDACETELAADRERGRERARARAGGLYTEGERLEDKHRDISYL